MIKKYLFICLDPAVLPRRAELRKAFRQLLTDGMNDLYYLRGYGLTGLDGENSVDGIHPCDGAVEQMYRKILPVIRKIFKK